MAPKELESGIYIISSRKDGAYVGRAINEDMSLLPKAVISLPPGVRAPFWIVEKLKADHYRLKIEGAPTGVKDKYVFAFLMETEKPEDWVIKHRDFHDAQRPTPFSTPGTINSNHAPRIHEGAQRS